MKDIFEKLEIDADGFNSELINDLKAYSSEIITKLEDKKLVQNDITIEFVKEKNIELLNLFAKKPHPEYGTPFNQFGWAEPLDFDPIKIDLDLSKKLLIVQISQAVHFQEYVRIKDFIDDNFDNSLENITSLITKELENSAKYINQYMYLYHLNIPNSLKVYENAKVDIFKVFDKFETTNDFYEYFWEGMNTDEPCPMEYQGDKTKNNDNIKFLKEYLAQYKDSSFISEILTMLCNEDFDEELSSSFPNCENPEESCDYIVLSWAKWQEELIKLLFIKCRTLSQWKEAKEAMETAHWENNGDCSLKEIKKYYQNMK
jgi:hypothetical protein